MDRQTKTFAAVCDKVPSELFDVFQTYINNGDPDRELDQYDNAKLIEIIVKYYGKFESQVKFINDTVYSGKPPEDISRLDLVTLYCNYISNSTMSHPLHICNQCSKKYSHSLRNSIPLRLHQSNL
jgi:hypothetical protein